jgi:hypothetical protein
MTKDASDVDREETAMRMKGNRITRETCLQITEAGKGRLRRIEQHSMLRRLMERSPIGDTVLTVLRLMSSGEVKSVKELVDSTNRDYNADFSSVMAHAGVFPGRSPSNVLILAAVRHCVRRGYLSVTLTIEG